MNREDTLPSATHDAYAWKYLLTTGTGIQAQVITRYKDDSAEIAENRILMIECLHFLRTMPENAVASRLVDRLAVATRFPGSEITELLMRGEARFFPCEEEAMSAGVR